MSQTCADARALKVYGNADATVVLTVLQGARLQSLYFVRCLATLNK